MEEVYPNVPGVDYNDKDSVMSQVMPSWWLEHDSCKYMLTMFVHKENKDLSLQPTTLPPGDTRKSTRKKRHAAMQEEWTIAKAAHPVEIGTMERYGDVDHQMKKTCVDGMRYQVDEIATNTIVTHIKVMCENADVYKAIMGKAKYNEQLVALINKMPGMILTAPTSIAAPADEDPNDDGNKDDEDSIKGEE